MSLFEGMTEAAIAEVKEALKNPVVGPWVRNIAIENWMGGYQKAVEEFSIWRDGKQYIGVLEDDPKAVIQREREKINEALKL
jgi:hypothetical protein